MDKKIRIDWHYDGKPDFSSGTGAYTSEKTLALLSALAVPGFLVLLLWRQTVDWTIVQAIIAFALAFDVSGGLVSNALNSCKRFYHTPPKAQEGRLGILLKRPFIFSLFHVHPILVGLLFGGSDWISGLIWYGVFLLSVIVVLAVPLYLKRPVSMLLIMAATLLNFYLIEPVAGFEWLMPLLFIKIIYGHLVREEPYRN